MGSLSIWHWIVVIAVVLLLFGRGKISDLMGDVAQGIKAFKKGMQDDEKTAEKPEPLKTLDHNATPSTAARSDRQQGCLRRGCLNSRLAIQRTFSAHLLRRVDLATGVRQDRLRQDRLGRGAGGQTLFKGFLFRGYWAEMASRERNF
jgi:sec-independent protein translocase protein TatA